jgi:hypothetical protein
MVDSSGALEIEEVYSPRALWPVFQWFLLIGISALLAWRVLKNASPKPSLLISGKKE